MLVKIPYELIREAMRGEPFTMCLSSTEAAAVVAAVNQGIDSHLEACNCPDRGDTYGVIKRNAGKFVTGHLECSVSVESLPTLLRRLTEQEGDTGPDLANSMLEVLGFRDDGTLRNEDE
jgi:hypothetical protein